MTGGPRGMIVAGIKLQTANEMHVDWLTGDGSK